LKWGGRKNASIAENYLLRIEECGTGKRPAAQQRVSVKGKRATFKEKNPDYWKGRYDDTKKWRQENPDYQQKWRLEKKEEEKKKSLSEIQAEKARYYIDSIEEKVKALREIQAELFSPCFAVKRPKALLSSQSP